MAVLFLSLCAFAEEEGQQSDKTSGEEPKYHQDVFGEQELRFGFKLGPQITGYTPIKTPSATVNVQSTMRFTFGAALKFIYEVPRFEVGLMWIIRGGVNTPKNYDSIAIPLLLKLPLEVEKSLDVEVGIGYQPELIVSGPGDPRTASSSIVASAGLAAILASDHFLDFEVRYLHGLNNISDDFNGASPREFQILGGLAWKL
ncbi:MAG: hypothetical protein AB1540_09925 [Bdellovibrionota bacterium]